MGLGLGLGLGLGSGLGLGLGLGFWVRVGAHLDCEPFERGEPQRACRKVHHRVERVGGGEVALDTFQSMVAE